MLYIILHKAPVKQASIIIANHHKSVPLKIKLNGVILIGSKNQLNKENTHPILVLKHNGHVNSIPKLSPTFLAHILNLKNMLAGPIP
jgi:hypothetical protein